MAQEPELIGEMKLRGLLTGDSIEGGGTFLLQPGGKRFELLVPDGVVIPVVAVDTPVLVVGRLAPETASFRQQGTPFQVARIEIDRSPSG